ncbi:hypothetical protein JAAARDRAFT_503826 [Jaapia argillacea MUCL 33604]|uniref:Uncharacterized protein n=1 Tax=Jaapia argillacea MUCL 33604 TaxID=933084 RepID=A0A067PMI7_9AGAM|nr:hypothetical protein JAAARDRAFT_503826 [Jaapia argillacea MUCL 33604]
MSHIWTRDSTLGEAEGAGRIPRPHHRSVMQPPSFPPQSTIPGWPTAPPTTFAPAPPPPLRLPLEPSPAKRSLRFLIDNGYPLQILYPHLIQCWKAYIRPDGSVYFRYQSTTGPTMRLVTCEDIRDPQIYETVMALTTDRLDRAQRSGTYDRFPDDWEFVVESAVASGIDNGPVMKLVSHKLGWTFFLQADHSLELGSKTDYWRCVSKYPMHLRTLPSGSDFDFLGALTFGVNGMHQSFHYLMFG